MDKRHGKEGKTQATASIEEGWSGIQEEEEEEVMGVRSGKDSCVMMDSRLVPLRGNKFMIHTLKV